MENLNRRTFFKSAAALGVLVAMPVLQGCPGGIQAKLVQLASLVGTGLAQILPYLQGLPSGLASTLQKSFSALQGAIQAWVPGTAIADIEQAVNTFVANMALIPVAGAYQPLVSLIVATVEGIVNLLVPAPAPVTQNVRAAFDRARAAYPHPPKTASQFESKFNSVAKARHLAVRID